MSTDSGSFMQNEANSGVSRTKHRSAGRAGSWLRRLSAHRILDLGFSTWDFRLCQNLARMRGGMGPAHVDNWTSAVHKVRPEEWLRVVASSQWSVGSTRVFHEEEREAGAKRCVRMTIGPSSDRRTRASLIALSRNFSITPGKTVGQLVAHSQANRLVRNA